jgi:hypothetical protein
MVSRQKALPGPPSFTRHAAWSSLDRLITAVALALPLALLVDGLVFASAVAWTGAAASLITALFLVSLWSLETRTVAMAPGWLAVRARLAPSWVVVPARDIVAVRRRRFLRTGLALKLTSGPPVYLRKGDMAAGMAVAMRECLGLVTTLEVAVAEALQSHESEVASTAGASGDVDEAVAASAVDSEHPAAPELVGEATPAGETPAGARGSVGVTPESALGPVGVAASPGEPDGAAEPAGEPAAAPPRGGTARVARWARHELQVWAHRWSRW